VGGAAGAALATIALVRLALPSEPPRHLDGAGPLASVNSEASNQTQAVNTAVFAGPWTFGIPLCIGQGQAPASLESVTPTKSIGLGYATLGTLIREWHPSPDDPPILSVNGYPVNTSAKLLPAAGSVVSQPCGGDPAAPAEYTELLIGLARTGPNGGGWQGVDVRYSVAGQERILELRQNMFVCGESVAAWCGGQSPSASQ
jgi:hypothetical protein